MKAGTTSLHSLLNNHPEISTGRVKEFGYFILTGPSTLDSQTYHSNFDSKKQIWGEVCPNYSKRGTFNGVAKRIAAYNPSAKIIYVTRDAIKRCLSETGHYLEEGETHEHTRIHWFKNHKSRRWKRVNASKFQVIPFGDFTENQIIQNSRYAYQLEPYREHFPEGQILVIQFEDLVKEPKVTITKVLNHIHPDLKDLGIPNLPHRHQTNKKFIPSDFLMLLREQSKYLDFKHWVFRFPILTRVLVSMGLLRALKPCTFSENLQVQLKEFL